MVCGCTSRHTAPANSFRYCNSTGRITVNDRAPHRDCLSEGVTRLAVEARRGVLIGRPGGNLMEISRWPVMTTPAQTKPGRRTSRRPDRGQNDDMWSLRASPWALSRFCGLLGYCRSGCWSSRCCCSASGAPVLWPKAVRQWRRRHHHDGRRIPHDIHNWSLVDRKMTVAVMACRTMYFGTR